MKSIQCKFLLDDGIDEHKYHLINCEAIKVPLDYGELGMSSLIKLNEAIQGK